MPVPRTCCVISAESTHSGAIPLYIPHFRLLLLNAQHASEWQQCIIQASRSQAREQNHVPCHEICVSWPNRELARLVRLILQSEESAHALSQTGKEQVCQSTQEDQIERDAQLVVHHGFAQYTTNALLLRQLCFLFARLESRGTCAEGYILNSSACS
jgi:hypothetical protein